MIKNQDFRGFVEDYHKNLDIHNNEYSAGRKKLQKYAAKCKGHSIQCVNDYDALYNSLKNISEKQYKDLKAIIEEHEQVKKKHKELRQSTGEVTNDLSGKMEDLEWHNELIGDMNKKYTVVIKLKESKIQDLAKEVEQLRIALNTKDFEHSNIKQKLQQSEIEQTLTTLDTQLTENNKIHQKFGQLRKSSIQNEKKSAQLEMENSILLEKYQETLRNSEMKSFVQKQNLQQHKEEIETLRDSHGSVSDTNQILKETNSALKQELSEMQFRYKILEAKFHESKNQNERKSTQLEMENSILSEQYQETHRNSKIHKQHLQEHKEKIATLQYSHGSVSDTNQILESTNSSLKQDLSEMELRYKTLELNFKEIENMYSSEITAHKIVIIALHGLSYNNAVLGEQMNNNKLLQNGGKNPVEEGEMDDVFANIATSKSFNFAFTSLREDKEILEVQLQDLQEDHRDLLKKYESLTTDKNSKESKLEYEIKVNEIVTILDKNRSGKIDFQEFKALYAENASEIFHQLDIDGSLDLSVDELKVLISSNKIADEILNQLKYMEENCEKNVPKNDERLESKEIEHLKKELEFQKNRMKTYVQYVNERDEESSDLKIEMGKKIADYVKNKKEQRKSYQEIVEKLKAQIQNLQSNDDSTNVNKNYQNKKDKTAIEIIQVLNKIDENNRDKKKINTLQIEIDRLRNLIENVCRYYYESNMY